MYKFDEASYKDENGIFVTVKLEDLIEMKKTDIAGYMQKYDRRLYCPECHKPQLALVCSNAQNCYLRGFPNQQHSEICSFSFPSVDTKAFTELLENPHNNTFVNAKLKKLVELLIKKRNKSDGSLLVRVDKNKVSCEEIALVKIQDNKTIRRLPTKSLTSPFNETDYDEPKLFYGAVDIQISERNSKSSEKPFYSLSIFGRNSKKAICSISMSEAVFSHLRLTFNFKGLDLIHTNVLLAVATKLVKKGVFTNGKIKYSDFCVITEI